MKDRCSDSERQNVLAKFSEKSLLTLYREMNFFWGKKLHIEWCLRKEIRWNSDKVRCLLCLGKEDAKRKSLDCWDTENWRLKFLNDKWLNMNKEIACSKLLRCINKDQINLGRYLDVVKCKWFNKIKEL